MEANKITIGEESLSLLLLEVINSLPKTRKIILAKMNPSKLYDFCDTGTYHRLWIDHDGVGNDIKSLISEGETIWQAI